MANNVGVAVGPAIGGFIAAVSYNIAFYIAAAGMLAYGLLMGFFAFETMPKASCLSTHPDTAKERYGGYGQILRDRPFMSFNLSITLTTICAALIWVLLAVYAKQNYGVPESQYGLIPTTNALMVIFFQFAVTQVTKRFSPLPVMALGAFFYALGCGGIVLGQGFWGFWLCMVVMTVGELILQPTASTYVAKLAPADKRGRYMSLYGLTWGIASGVGPVFGGLLNDKRQPAGYLVRRSCRRVGQRVRLPVAGTALSATGDVNRTAVKCQYRDNLTSPSIKAQSLGIGRAACS